LAVELILYLSVYAIDNGPQRGHRAKKMTGEAIVRGQAASLSQAITEYVADGLYVTDSEG
jgi:hypothetical protein